MNKNKGFTLIELLAVIIVLAVVALISIPTVSNVINSGKESATKDSTIFYVKELESYFSEWIIEGIPNGLTKDTSESGYIKFNVTELNEILNLDGTLPVSGTVKIDNNYSADNYYYGYVVSADLTYDNGYRAIYSYITSNNYKGNRSNVSIIKK